MAHGLPYPANLEVAAACEAAVSEAGSVPATIGVLDGRLVVGMNREEVARIAQEDVLKLSARDLGLARSRGLSGATTVAGTIVVAALAGVSVMATGGMGGVHRGARETFDESADLATLARTPVLVVASGVKSILDVGATLERLDSLAIPVAGYRTERFPGFYRRDSGFGVDWTLESPLEVARAFAAQRDFDPRGFLLANPVAEESELDEELHDRALAAALSHAEKIGARGKEVTPVILAEFARVSGGASVSTNRDLVVANAHLAGSVARELASLT